LVTAAPKPIAVLLLTEDSAKDAPQVLEKLVRAALKLVVARPGPAEILFTPPPEQAAWWMHGNLWRSEGNLPKAQVGQRNRHLRDLTQSIATHLLLRERLGVVCFHYDGDAAWSGRPTSPTTLQFARIIRTRVRDLLTNPASGQASLHGRQPVPGLRGTELGAACDRLVEVVPYYSIEAWLYQNLDEADRIAATPPESISLQEQLASWRADRHQIERVLQIKKNCGLHDRHNLALATNWTARMALPHGRSFRWFLWDLARSRELRLALKSGRR
jgi:hypothetical protein